MATTYFLGSGELFIGDRSAAGANKGFLSIGNAPKVELSGEATFLTHKESITGEQLTDLKIPKDKMVKLTADFENFSKENLALAFYGNINAVTAGTATAEAFTNGYTVLTADIGKAYKLAHTGVSAVVITDSAGSPATLSLGTDYTVDAVAGYITILSLGSYTQPFKAAYSYAAATQIGLMTADIVEKYVYFRGINTAVSPAKYTIFELYRVQFEPSKNFNFIDDNLGKFSFAGEALQDTSKSASATLGQFGYIDLPA